MTCRSRCSASISPRRCSCAPIGLIGLCAPDFQGDVAAAQASAATGVPFTLSTFSQAPMEDVIKHAGTTPNFYQLYLPGDRELAASFINRAETSGYSALVLTVDSWALGYRPADLAAGKLSAVPRLLHGELLLRRELHQTPRKATPRRSGRRVAALREDLRSTRCRGKTSVGFGRRPIFPSR